ncbi:MAG: hypothetical protein JWQ10_131 [Herbaspirillum sp.]|nr:hypothetical protein [Herbaspirillum sp.]
MKIRMKKNNEQVWSIVLLIVALSLLGIGFGATVTQGWWKEVIWSSGVVGRNFRECLAIGLIGYIILLRLRIPFLFLIVPSLILCVGLTGLGPLMSVVWFWLCAALIGGYILGLSEDADGHIWTTRDCAVGFAIIGSLIGLLVHFPICTPAVLFVLFSSAALFSACRLQKNGRLHIKLENLLAFQRRPWPEIIILAFVLAGATLVLMVTMLPDIGHDALSMHLNIPARILESKLWKFDVTQYTWAVEPMGANWLLVPSYFLGGEQGARLMSSSFLFATAWLSYRMMKHRVGSLAALTVPAILLTLPLTLMIASSVFVESALGFYFLICFAELIGTTNVTNGRWFVMGVTAGYACAIKLLGAPIIPLLLAGAWIRSRTGKFQSVTFAVVAIAVIAFFVCGLPPYLVAYWKTGNPFFPFYNDIFHSPFFSTGSVFGNGRGFSNPMYEKPLSIQLFWDAVISSKGFGESAANGAVGIVLLIFFPLSVLSAIVHRRWAMLTAIMAAMFYVVLVFNSQAYLRYIYQIIPWFLILGCWALSGIAYPRISTTLLVSVLCLINLARFPVASGPLQQFDPSLFLDRAAGEAFLVRNKPVAVVGDIIRKMDDLSHRQILVLGTDPVFSHFPGGTIADSWHSWSFFTSDIKFTHFGRLIGQLGIEVIVHTIGQNEPHEAEVMNLTDEVFRFHNIRVGLVKPELLYTRERIVGPDLHKLEPSWKLNGAIPTASGVDASVNSAITQTVDFGLNKKALLEMKVACPENDLFRSQINWTNAKDVFISTDIELHPCKPEGITIRRVITRPEGAVKAIVYGGGQTDQAVNIREISLRTAD